MDRGAWWAVVQRGTKSWTRLSMHARACDCYCHLKGRNYDPVHTHAHAHVPGGHCRQVLFNLLLQLLTLSAASPSPLCIFHVAAFPLFPS